MSWTYSGDPENSNNDKVRLWIGDTNPERQLLSDEEISFFISRVSSDIFRACADACDAISAKFARDSKSRVRGNLVDIDSVWLTYKTLAKEFRRRTISTSALWAVITKDQKDTFNDDTDLLKPGIRVGMTDSVNEAVHRTNSTEADELD